MGLEYVGVSASEGYLIWAYLGVPLIRILLFRVLY